MGSPGAVIVGNGLLLDEMNRYTGRFRSPAALRLHAALVAKMKLVETDPRFLKACLPFVGGDDPVDLLLAATALKEDAVLVTNDRHFTRLREAEVVEVWTIAEAVDRLLVER